VPEEEMIVLKSNTLRAKMNGIVINPDINLDEIEEYDAS
jgi:hypothetical protein